MEVTIGLALIAGFVSFISPCVLPLVPAYIGYMGGRMTNTVASGLRAGESENQVPMRMRLSTFLHGTFFVTGFSLVFVSIGLLSTAFIQQIGGANIRLVTDLIGRLGGILIIVFGLHFMGILPKLSQWLRAREALLRYPATTMLSGILMSILIFWGLTGSVFIWISPLWNTTPLFPIISVVLVASLWLWMIRQDAFGAPGPFWLRSLDKIETALYSDTRHQINSFKQGNYFSSAAMGVVFSAGWTPCIGPVYGTVLTIAANGGQVGQAGVMLAAYSLGLGIPFLLTALLLDSAQGWLRKIQRHMPTVELASGVFLIIIGLTVATGQLQSLSEQFAGQFAEFSIRAEQQAIHLITGQQAFPSEEVPSSSQVNNTSSNEETGSNIGQIAPDFQTVTDTGEPISLNTLRGNIVLLNFWATWCGPCRIEMPEFQRQFERYADQDFTVLAVNNSESLENVIDFREQLELTFPLALDERGEIQRQYGIMSYPSTFLLDRNGRIVARHFGALTTQQIDQMLADVALSS